MASKDFLFCHGCGRRLVRVNKADRYRCSYCWATWLSPENYAKGNEGREPWTKAMEMAKKDGII